MDPLYMDDLPTLDDPVSSAVRASTVTARWYAFRETAEQIAHDHGYELVWYERGVDTRCGQLAVEVLPSLWQDTHDAMMKAGQQ